MGTGNASDHSEGREVHYKYHASDHSEGSELKEGSDGKETPEGPLFNHRFDPDIGQSLGSIFRF